MVLLGNNKAYNLLLKISLELCPKKYMFIIVCLICRSEYINNRFGIHIVESI